MTRPLFGTAFLLIVSLTLFACGGGSTTAAPEPPLVAGVELSTGGVGGGNEIVIKGDRLANTSAGTNTVLIGGNPAEQIKVRDDQTITCRTPSGVQGPCDVSVTKNHGTGTLESGFTYHPSPTILTIDPVSGSRGGGEDVTVKGTGFLNNNPVETVVLIGLKALTDLVVVDDETITGKTPSSSTEVAKDVTVVNNNGQSSIPFGFLYFGFVPELYTVAPPEGPAAGGTLVTLTGDFYTLAGGVLTVTFGSVQAAGVQRLDDQHVECLAPAGPPAESVDVSIGNGNGTSTIVDGYYYIPPPPTLSSATPNRGVMTKSTPTTLTGTGFLNYGAGTNTVTIGAQQATNVVVVNDTTITCIAPSVTTPQIVDITVTNTNGSAVLTGGFEYFKPPLWAAKGACSGGGLYKIDTDNWTATQVGSGTSSFTGIAVDPATRIMYGWGDRCNGGGLYTINTTTGASTSVGGSGVQMGDITIFPSGSSWLLYGYTFSSYTFVEINKATGGTTTQSSVCCYWWGNGYASDANGNCYFAEGQSLSSVNPSTGSVSYVGSTGRYTQSMTFHDGVLYGEERYGSDSLYTISTSSGSASVVMSLPGSIDSLASEFP